MPNGIRPNGDDQQWKDAVDRELAELRRLVGILQSQTTNLNRG